MVTHQRNQNSYCMYVFSAWSWVSYENVPNLETIMNYTTKLYVYLLGNQNEIKLNFDKATCIQVVP